MNNIPSDLIYKIPEARKQWESKIEQRKSRSNRGPGFRGLTQADAIFSYIKNGLQSYGIHSDAEKLAKSIVKMVGIENKNIEYLSAAIFLYNIHSSELEKTSDITPEMFNDKTPAMIKIREKLDKGSETKSLWVNRKINILAYLSSIIEHIAEGQEDFKPSQVYSKYEKEDEEVEEEMHEDYQENVVESPGNGEL